MWQRGLQSSICVTIKAWHFAGADNHVRNEIHSRKGAERKTHRKTKVLGPNCSALQKTSWLYSSNRPLVRPFPHYCPRKQAQRSMHTKRTGKTHSARIPQILGTSSRLRLPCTRWKPGAQIAIELSNICSEKPSPAHLFKPAHNTKAIEMGVKEGRAQKRMGALHHKAIDRHAPF